MKTFKRLGRFVGKVVYFKIKMYIGIAWFVFWCIPAVTIGLLFTVSLWFIARISRESLKVVIRVLNKLIKDERNNLNGKKMTKKTLEELEALEEKAREDWDKAWEDWEKAKEARKDENNLNGNKDD
jgi:hypothetical protein